MALVVYEIYYDVANGQGATAPSKENENSVTVETNAKLEVGDRVQFTSKNPKAAIKFRKEPPFEVPKELKDPKAMAALKAAKTLKPFLVNKKTAEFKVVRPILKSIRFQCGTLEDGLVGPVFTPLGPGGVVNGTDH